MSATWTGQAGVADLRWLGYALVFSGALLVAHVCLRLARSHADQLELQACPPAG